METRKFGNTDLEVTRLAFGGARIGFEDVTDDQVDALLNGLLDNGVTFLDTAACYDDSEELIGKFVSHRREEYVLASKCGHVAGDATGEPWTADTINHSIDRSLRLLKTDRIDLMQLHSCSAEVLKKGEAVEAVQRAQEAGKVRYLSYSGDGDNALHAIGMGIFATLQTSFNVVDQRRALSEAARILKPGGWMVCLWNHRQFDAPIQRDIEDIIKANIDGYDYGTRRQDQTDAIQSHGRFGPVAKFEYDVTHRISTAAWLDAWRSHATLQRQCGDKFGHVIAEIGAYLAGLKAETITVPYTSRAWMAEVAPA